MKRNKLVSIAAITVALGVLATGCAGGSGSSKSDSKSSGGTKTVTVKAGTGANVKPYTYVGDDNETTGYDVEVLKEVFDRLDGYDLQIEVTDIPSVFSGVTTIKSENKKMLEAANGQSGIDNIKKMEEEILTLVDVDKEGALEKALVFYGYLNELPEDELLSGNYSHEKIKKGLKMVAEHYGILNVIDLIYR